MKILSILENNFLNSIKFLKYYFKLYTIWECVRIKYKIHKTITEVFQKVVESTKWSTQQKGKKMTRISIIISKKRSWIPFSFLKQKLTNKSAGYPKWH